MMRKFKNYGSGLEGLEFKLFKNIIRMGLNKQTIRMRNIYKNFLSNRLLYFEKNTTSKATELRILIFQIAKKRIV